jgi:hypothetical protein
VVARWRYGAFRVVGLEFLEGASRVDTAKLTPHLAQLKHLEFIKLPQSTAADSAKWRNRLPERYAVLHCPTEGE